MKDVLVISLCLVLILWGVMAEIRDVVKAAVREVLEDIEWEKGSLT